MKKILIVGASGMLGSKMVALYSGHYEVVGTYATHPIENNNAYMLDVCDRVSTAELLEKISPDLVIDVHAIADMEYCENNQEEAWRVNVEGSKNLAECARNANSKYILISSTDVFDGKLRKPYTENDEPNPINYYGVTKLAAENAVNGVFPDSIIARSALLFGEGGTRKSHFTGWLMQKLREGKEVTVVTDQVTNITYVDHLADFVIRLYESGAKGLFHTAGKDIVSKFQFAKKIATEFGLDGNLIAPTTTEKLNFHAKRPLWTGLDISKAEQVTGLKGMGLEEAIGRFRRNMGN